MFRGSTKITNALREAIQRVEAWGSDSKLRVEDVRNYIRWQTKALADALAWYYEDNSLECVVGSVQFPESMDRACGEITKHASRMLRCGRFDDYDWEEVEEVNSWKRRRVGL